jgi:hypothetical protein
LPSAFSGPCFHQEYIGTEFHLEAEFLSSLNNHLVSACEHKSTFTWCLLENLTQQLLGVCLGTLRVPCLQGGEGGDDENKFDEFLGNDAGVFAGGQYDEDDKEADRIWESVDNFMDERRRVSCGFGP